MAKQSNAKKQEEILETTYSSTIEDSVDIKAEPLEKEIDFDPESILESVDSDCKAIYAESYEITKSFGENQMSSIMKEAATALAATLHSIQQQNKKVETSFFGRMKRGAISLLPATLQNVVDKTSETYTEAKVLSQSVGKTTDEIFNNLNGQAESLKAQILKICEMEDGLSALKGKLANQSDKLATAFNMIAENDGFNGRKALEFKMREAINTINIHIKEFESQEERIYQSKIAAEGFLEQLKGKLPHIKTSLINGLATMAFMEEVGALQENFNSLCQSVNDISITNTARIGQLMSEITDTARFNRLTMESLQKQEEIQNETRIKIKENFKNNQLAISEQSKFLIGVDKKNQENINDDVLRSSKSTYYKTPELVDTDNRLTDKTS